MHRRALVKGLATLLSLGLLPLNLYARAVAAFTAEQAADVYRELFGSAAILPSDRIHIKAPEIAENGAVVPITVSTDLANTQSISVVIDENPNPLSGTFYLTEDSAPEFSLRVKMGRSSTIRALVRTADGVYMSGRQVKVTIGGCGG